MSDLPPAPASILIVGAGVFGLSTALALTTRSRYAHTQITVLDRCAFPAPDSSSIDSSRIIRADYSDGAYAALAAQAQRLWRTPAWGGDGRYEESGLLLTCERGKEEYVRASFANVSRLQAGDDAGSVQELDTPAAIAAAARTGGGGSGAWGYLNRRSGWADASAAMHDVHRRLAGSGRVRFVTGEAEELVTGPGGAVEGVRVRGAAGPLRAGLTVVATGAWTAALLDVGGRCAATAQTVAYVPVSAAEAATLAGMPVVLNMSTGFFVTPPHAARGHLKVARHAYGYANPRAPSHGGPLASAAPAAPPPPGPQPLPAAAEAELRRALGALVPALAERPFAHTRLCWYTDTPTGDFLIARSPHRPGLVVATGGSGHAFKFLPVIGDKVLDCVEGSLEEPLRSMWAWPERPAHMNGTEDGSRGGERGLVLAEELRKGGGRL